MNGKLLVIDGLDGSGKQTQAARLCTRLQADGRVVIPISFPDYDNPSSALVKEYLAGVYGQADEVSAYAASSFYAVDRYASYNRVWKKLYLEGHTIIADRYATSNLIHQMSKLPQAEWDAFHAWMEDYEYQKLGLPRPDAVIYLDMHPKVSRALLTSRYAGDESKKDIHESNFAYLLRCRACALYAAEHFGWIRISCSDEQTPRTVEAIAQDIYRAVCAL